MNHINWAWSHEYANPDSSNSDFFFPIRIELENIWKGIPYFSPGCSISVAYPSLLTLTETQILRQ